jgi:hypothetical protein
MRMITVEILGVDVYAGVIAFAIGMVIMVALMVATYIDSKKEGN